MQPEVLLFHRVRQQQRLPRLGLEG
jgi:hypothetical protein